MIARYIFLILFLGLLVGSVSAVIPVNVSEVGCTYIQWNWTPGLTLTDMFLDGNVLCGYETTDPGYLATGLSSGELHNLTIITAGDSGTNITRTTTENCTAPGGGGFVYIRDEPSVDLPISAGIPALGIAIAIIALVAFRRKE